MKEEDYVSLEVAKLLKEKGYNEPSKYFYRKDDGKLSLTSGMINNNEIYEVVDCTAHPLAEVAKWLREKHKIAVCPFPYSYHWDYNIYDLKTIDIEDYHSILGSRVAWSSYEEALNEGIKEALKLI